MCARVEKSLLEEQLSNIVGPEDIFIDIKDLEKYSKDGSFTPARNPQFAVRPENTDEVLHLVRLANNTKTPLIPYSSGMIRQGSAVPCYGGVIIDLSKMNRIIDVDTEGRSVAIEPGVTFNQLQEEVGKHRLKVCTAVGLPGSASVLSAYLEFAPLYSWSKYGTLFLPTMEVVLPSGEVMGTGSWAWANARIRGVSPLQFAAGLSSIFHGAQGTLGIVTKGRILLKNLHEVREVYFIPMDSVQDAPKLIHGILRTSPKGLGEECFAANGVILGNMMGKTAEEWSNETNLKTIVLVLSGWQDEVEYQRHDLRDTATKLGINLLTEIGEVEEAGKLILDEIAYPRGFYSRNNETYYPIQFIAEGRSLTALDRIFNNLAKEYRFPEGHISWILLPVEKGRAYCCEYGVYWDTREPGEKERAREFWLEASRRLVEHGAFFDRPYGPWAQLTYSRMSNYYGLLRRFKELFDPNNIMNPGRLF